MLQFRGELCYVSLSTSTSYIARRLVTYQTVWSKSVDAYAITHHVYAPGSEQVVTQVVKIRRAEFKLFVTVVRQVCQFALKIAGWDDRVFCHLVYQSFFVNVAFVFHYVDLIPLTTLAPFWQRSHNPIFQKGSIYLDCEMNVEAGGTSRTDTHSFPLGSIKRHSLI